MDFRDTPEEAAFRRDLRTWLRQHLPAGWIASPPPRPVDQGEDEQLRRWWQRELYDGGWAGLAWPEQYGGRGATLVEQAVFIEETGRVRAPEPLNVIGLNMAGPTIIAHGTDEQKRRYLPGILSAEEIWCRGFSEPGAGSDLGGARTRAVREGDCYVVDGQKVWTSYGHIADFCILFARSDPEARQGAAFTYLLADMHAEGVTVRPLRQITGEPEFNEVFFDGVRIPVEARLAREGDGWAVAMTTLLHERATLSFSLQVQSTATFDRLVALVRRLGRDDDPWVRRRLAGLRIQVEGLRITGLRALSGIAGGTPGPEGSVGKLMWERVQQQMTEFAVQLLALDAQAPTDEEQAEWQRVYLRARGNSIEAGTTEILRSIVAERVLGLPRSR